jgi:heme/copper-type cytochrome/quinol oxidase subunit 3
MVEPRFEMPDPPPKRKPTPEQLAVSRSRFHPVELAMYVFMASLGMFFASSLIAYFIIRMTGARLAAVVPISLPPSIWVSTLALITTSIALSRSLRAVKRERQLTMRRWLVVSSILGFIFLAVQGYSLFDILDTHLVALEHRMSLYGVVFFLVALHAVHVLGGMVCLTVVTMRAFQNAYDHECYRGMKICVIYWHFLDIVWIFMLLAFLATS